MDNNLRAVIAWSFVMVAFSAIPYATTIIIEPGAIHMVILMLVIGAVAGFVGNLFK